MDIVAIKAAVKNGTLMVKVHNSNILLGEPKSGEWVKIGELFPQSEKERRKW